MKRKGLADESPRQRVLTFFSMAKKQLIVMTRYPISFITGFGQIFLIFMVFFLAVVMFVPSPLPEWSPDDSFVVDGTGIWVEMNSAGEVVLALEPRGVSGNVAIFWRGNGSGGLVWNVTSNGITPTEPTFYVASDEFMEAVLPVKPVNGTMSLMVHTANWTFPAGADINDPLTWAHFSANGTDNATLLLGVREFPVSVDGEMGTYSEGEEDLGILVVYGLVMFIFLSEALWTIGFSIRDEQYQGTLESLYTTPASKFTNLVSRVFPTLAWTGAMAVVMVGVTGLVTGTVPVANLDKAAVILLFSLSGTFGIGFAFAAVALRIKESIQLLINIAQFGLMLLSAMMFPFSVLPDVVVDYGSRWIPFSYCVDAFRSVLMDRPPELLPLEQEMVVVVLFGIFMPFLGYLLFRWQERVVREKGTLSEY